MKEEARMPDSTSKNGGRYVPSTRSSPISLALASAASRLTTSVVLVPTAEGIGGDGLDCGGMRWKWIGIGGSKSQDDVIIRQEARGCELSMGSWVARDKKKGSHLSHPYI